MIPSEFIEQLLERVDLVDIIGSRVKLKKAGKEYMGLCPFHDEKSPSFSVVPDKGFYHCFGCGAHGHAIRFLTEHDRLGFVQAVESLAQRVGLEVPRERMSPQAMREKDERERFYVTLSEGMEWFRRQLREHAGRRRAVDYLKGRGLTGEIAERFQLGYAPPGNDNLLRELGGNAVREQQLLDAGLIGESDDGRRYDRFRDRIIFPIRDRRGRVVAYGGRVIGDGKPKYLNSPETLVFHKGRELYGLYEARQAERQLRSVLVVEGYMDVVALARHGIANVVATLGTATSREHLELLFREVEDVLFCFDGDAAGRRAAWKALQEALPLMEDGRRVRFLFLPEGEDPDSLVQAEGNGRFRERLAAAAELSGVFFDHVLAESDIAADSPLSAESKARLARRAMELLGPVPSGVFRSLMQTRLAEMTGLDVGTLRGLQGLRDSRGSGSPGGGEQAVRPVRAVSSRPERRQGQVRPVGEKALKLLLQNPSLAERYRSGHYQLLQSVAGSTGLFARVAMRALQSAATGQMTPEALGGTEEERRYLRHLAAGEMLLDAGAAAQEYVEIVDILLREQHERQQLLAGRQAIANRRPSEMSEEEKNRLRAMFSRPSAAE